MKLFKLKKLLAGLTLTATLLAPFSAQAISIPEGRATSGDLTISGSRTEDSVHSNINTLASAGASAVVLASATGFTAGDYVMITQTFGTGASLYEFQKILTISSNTLNLAGTLTNSYQSTGAQVVKVNEYHNVTVANGGTWTASAWDGTKGGILVAFLNGGLTLQTGGTITASSLGFSGGAGAPQFGASCGTQGNSTSGNGAAASGQNANSGGGGCAGVGTDNVGGGGGGNVSAGGDGTKNGGSAGTVGQGGALSGSATLSTSIFFGGAGGGAECNTASCSATDGGRGAGIIILVSASTTVSQGTFTNVGADTSSCGVSGGASGGSGAGGSVRLPVRLNITLGSTISAVAGTSGTTNCNGIGGTGSTGRVGTVSTATVTGTSNPTINTSSTDVVLNKDNEAQKMILSFSM